MAENKIETGEAAAAASPQKKAPKGRRFAIIGVAAVLVAAVGIGFWEWHETPGFCASICHNMDPYLETYLQDEGVAGVDKYGNAVSDTTALLSTRHRETNATGKPEIRCMGCHHPVVKQQISEAVQQTTGGYEFPQTEPTLSQLTAWEGTEGTQFCVNSGCHSYLRGSDGLVDRKKLEESTSWMDFNPHAQHHENLQVECGECHKGHRASVMVCTGCHQHENVSMPSGWVTKAEGDRILADAKANAHAALS
ncbi:MAG: cytochrome c3 family protein [Berryella intestinalis]|uniref:cytochrome c3 family protein n=1 Tax=Berryella intestinalis TaxID=1531429 RepID=UPI002A582944|nr:cytochrome c3 family protein [Berryella intestinalis]MDD7369777.1 cytochrome c3 family protein [Berryella intestinalis]MDY3128498.1 cytochrome c3 family protein [Berryella intestinalis]